MILLSIPFFNKARFVEFPNYLVNAVFRERLVPPPAKPERVTSLYSPFLPLPEYGIVW
jgi:hypothetical protein